MRKALGREDIEEVPYSRMDLKRSHQWLTESSDSELYSNKRQMVEIDPLMNLSPWDNHSVSRQSTDCFLLPAYARHGQNISPLIDGQEGRRRYVEEQCSNVLSIGLPVVHASSFDPDTISRVKASEASESGNMPESMVQLYGDGISRSFDMFPSYTSGQDSFILPGGFASKGDGNFIRNFINEGIGVIPMGGIYDDRDGNVLSTIHPFEKGVETFALMGQSLQKADCNNYSTSPLFYKAHENFSSFLSCDKAPQNLFMTESYHRKENANVLSVGQSPCTAGGEMAFMVSSQNNARISHRDRSQTISFGDYQKDTTTGSSVRVINSCENMSHAPATGKDPLHAYDSPRVDTLLVPKSKDSKTIKKSSTNTFPTNVKSLLSTGIFDGVTVKYYSWSREKNLKGIIKGTGYLCGCVNCNFDKILNAYEFERHANCKTKHPNNHIYFENGKTIYGVAQELKNTPQEKLFDAIQNVTGSDINRKNFDTWKASYQVASLELQRIFGKDDVTLAS